MVGARGYFVSLQSNRRRASFPSVNGDRGATPLVLFGLHTRILPLGETFEISRALRFSPYFFLVAFRVSPPAALPRPFWRSLALGSRDLSSRTLLKHQQNRTGGCFFRAFGLVLAVIGCDG